jgi:hypothetical protein
MTGRKHARRADILDVLFVSLVNAVCGTSSAG